ncbi:hypothetical protein D9M70_557740 [compost metagenome]
MATAKRYTQADREALIAEYNLGGMAITAFCKLPGKPAYQVFKKWLEDAAGTAVPKKTATSLYAEFQANEEREDARFLRFLKGKRAELQAALAEVEAEIAKREPEPASTLETEGD